MIIHDSLCLMTEKLYFSKEIGFFIVLYCNSLFQSTSKVRHGGKGEERCGRQVGRQVSQEERKKQAIPQEIKGEAPEKPIQVPGP